METPAKLQIGKKYQIFWVEWGSDDFGTWKFIGAASGRLHFINDRDAEFSIPKDANNLTPASHWVVRQEEE